MVNIKKMVGLLVMALSLFSLTGCGGEKAADDGAPKKMSFTLALDSPEDSVTYLFADKVKQELEARSEGTMTIQVYANGTLGGDREAIESTQQGSVDMVAQTTAPQVNFIPNLAVFDIPAQFANINQVRKFVDGPYATDVLAGEYESAGFKLLGYADQGFREMSTNKAVKSVEDFKGQKIRTMENPNHIKFWQSVGANPTPMAFAEVYIGLQQGTIDAQENPYEVIVSAKLYEQQKYVVNTNHIPHLISLIMNNNKFNSLTPEQQTMITESVDAAKVWARQQADDRLSQRAKIMTDAGTEIIDLTPEVQAQFAQGAEPVKELVSKTIGSEFVETFEKAVAEAKK